MSSYNEYGQSNIRIDIIIKSIENHDYNFIKQLKPFNNSETKYIIKHSTIYTIPKLIEEGILTKLIWYNIIKNI